MLQLPALWPIWVHCKEPPRCFSCESRHHHWILGEKQWSQHTKVLDPCNYRVCSCAKHEQQLRKQHFGPEMATKHGVVTPRRMGGCTSSQQKQHYWCHGDFRNHTAMYDIPEDSRDKRWTVCHHYEVSWGLSWENRHLPFTTCLTLCTCWHIWSLFYERWEQNGVKPQAHSVLHVQEPIPGQHRSLE